MQAVPGNPIVLVHGGAGGIPDDVVAAYAAGIKRAADAGWRVLERGGSAVETVEAAIVSMEDADVFNAGSGGVLRQDGRVQLDAMMMDGASLAAGAVAAIEHVRNAITVARLVMERSTEVLYVGEGAERFAREQAVPTLDNEDLVTERERQRLETRIAGADPAHDTVGAVALDAAGNLAAGTSTGGIAFKPVGRVGDSAIIGSGGYADNDLAAVSCTGEGEAFMRLVLAKWAADRVGSGRPPQAAADEAISHLGMRLGARGGMIVLDRAGRWGVAFNAPRMAWAVRSEHEDSGQVASRVGT
jgi:beta-aspartyl-peptidase (threonine type)